MALRALHYDAFPLCLTLCYRRQAVHERSGDRLETASVLLSRFEEALKSVDALEASMSAKEKELAEGAEQAHRKWQSALGEWTGAHAIAVDRVGAAAKQLAAEGDPTLAVRPPPLSYFLR